MNKFIITILENKYYLIITSVFIALLFISYNQGKKAGFIPAPVLCKEDILNLDACKDELKEFNKMYAEDMIKCKAECKLVTCKDQCIVKMKEAVENYKQLEKVLECND